MSKKEKENKRLGLIISSAFHVIVILLLFAFTLTTEEEKEEPATILMDFTAGSSSKGGASSEPTPSETVTEEQTSNTDPVITQMNFSDRRCFVPGCGQRRRHGRRGTIERNAVGADTVPARSHPGEKRGAAGHAERTVDVCARKIHAAGRELIQVRRANRRIAGATHVVGAPLVGADGGEVGARAGHGDWPLYSERRNVKCENVNLDRVGCVRSVAVSAF